MVSESADDKAKRLLTGQEKSALPRRFYTAASVEERPNGLQILLDGRPVKTPLKAPLAVPGRALADAMAAEWMAQGEHIDPHSMPCTRLANTAIDRVAGRTADIVAEICEFAASDLVCYRADSPEGLVTRQSETWDPLLGWMAKTLGARFVAVTGLVHEPQPEPTMVAVRDYLTACDDLALTAVHNLTTLTGSCVLAVTLREGVISADAGWAAAHIDEDWQIEHWGMDEEASRRRAHYRREYDATLAFMALAAGE